jgi:DMSO/TMAO reductase YedYZ molybdopterin-dependent catalytic subunit
MWNPFKQPATAAAHRIPPNQRLTDGFPILHEGAVPAIDLATWDLRVWGEGVEERRYGWEQLMALPQVQLVNDFHCVTGWSKLDNVWEGVRAAELLKDLDAPYVMAYGHVGDDPYGYATNLPMDVLREPDVLLAHSHNGRPLTPDHGWPLRLVVPKRYAWKSCKWLRGLELMGEDRRGYWESRGYHNRAEPFAEERFSSQERPEQRMRVRGKDHS